MGSEQSKPIQSKPNDICPILFGKNIVKPEETILKKSVPLRIKIPPNTIDLTRSSLRSYKSIKNEFRLNRIEE